MITLRTLLTAPLFLSSFISALAVTPAVVQSSLVSSSSTAMTLTLPKAPVVGDTLFALVGFGIYAVRTITPPDSSWVCTEAAGGGARLSTCSHIVTAGDGTSYAFSATDTGPGMIGILLEATNTASVQIASNYSGTSVATTTTPALTPTVAGMLPVAVTFGGGLPVAGQAGWTALQAVSGIGAFVADNLTNDTVTPVSLSLNYTYNNGGSSLQQLLLLTPGVIAPAPMPSPAGGSYATMQTVSLSDVAMGATVHYTLDGSTPSCSSPAYGSPINLATSASVTFLACAPGYANSAVVTAKYVIGAGTLNGISTGAMGDLHGYVPFAGDAFHQAINASAVDSNSANIIAGIGAGHLHHDWSSINGGNYGIPYNVVDSSQIPLVPFTNQLYASESDVSLYPIPSNLQIEGAPANCTTQGDNHAIMFDKYTGVEYELFAAQDCIDQTPQWIATNGVMWDTTINEKRPYGYTSADAAGLSIFEGLVRYDEIVAGAINHALRFTTAQTRCDHYYQGDGQGSFVPPATHAACNNSGTLNITGMRIRLKASFDISSYSPTNQIILTAMKTYGMILADNGGSLYFQGTPDARWNDSDLTAIDAVAASNFEVVAMPAILTNDHLPQGTAPVVNSFTASSTNIAKGQSVTLTSSVTGASYSYIDLAGFTRGSVTVTPTQTTTYQLMTRNAFGEATASVTVTVSAAVDPQLTIAPIATQTYGAAPVYLAASSQSSEAIAYAVVSGPATLVNNVITPSGVGVITLRASQASTASYLAATAVTSFTVIGAIPTLAFTPVANMAYGSPAVQVATTSNSTGAIAYTVLSGPATIDGTTVTATGAGTVTLQATQAAAGNYSATTAHSSFTVTPIAPTLSFIPVQAKVFGSLPFAVTSVSNSSGATTYSVASGPATLYGNTVTLTGVGSVTLLLQQAAYGNYSAATATITFNVTPKAVGIAFNPIATKVYGAAPFQVSITTPPTAIGFVIYQVVSGPAKVFGNTVMLTGPGTVVLTAIRYPLLSVLDIAVTSFKVVSPGN